MMRRLKVAGWLTATLVAVQLVVPLCLVKWNKQEGVVSHQTLQWLTEPGVSSHTSTDIHCLQQSCSGAFWETWDFGFVRVKRLRINYNQPWPGG